jgi:hypothetical protein
MSADIEVGRVKITHRRDRCGYARYEFIPVLNLYPATALGNGPQEGETMAVRARRTTAVAARSHSPTLKTRIYRAATHPAAKATYVAIGAAGLAALAIAVFGPRRFQREIVQPMREKVADQAEKLWSEAKPLRAQLSGLIESAASESGREKLIRSFQSWIGHFRAT